MSSFDDDFNQMVFNQDYRKCERLARDLCSWQSTKRYVGSAVPEVLPSRTPCKTELSECTANVHAAIWFQRPDKNDEDFSESLSLYMCRHNWYVNYKRTNNFSVSDVLSDNYKTYPIPAVAKTKNPISDEIDAIEKTFIDFVNYVS
jgi:hypothetical protein